MTSMWQLLPPTTLLLLASMGASTDLPKAIVSLDPEWDRVLTGDSVTMKCQGTHTQGDNSIQWWHNGNLLSNQKASYSITDAKVNDTGEYRCQTNLSALSDPVQLQVHAVWLLLQARRWVVQEGEPILLRCHSWKNFPVNKVQYFQNRRGKKYFYGNSEFYIPKATGKHNGSYFCRGMLGKRNESSEAVNVIVQALPRLPSSPWHLAVFCLLLGFLFAVDTGLYFSVKRDLQSSLRNGRNYNLTWSKSPEDKQKQENC